MAAVGTTMSPLPMGSPKKRNNLIDYTKSRARFVGERGRGKRYLERLNEVSHQPKNVIANACAARHNTSIKDDNSIGESSASTGNSSSSSIHFQMRNRFQVDPIVDDCGSESDAHSDSGYLPGEMQSQPAAPAVYPDDVSESEESTNSISICYLAGSVQPSPRQSSKGSIQSSLSSSALFHSSQSNSMLQSSMRSEQSIESFNLGRLSHSFVKRHDQKQDGSCNTGMSVSVSNRSPDCVMTDFFLQTPTSRTGKSELTRSSSRSCLLHTPLSLKNAKYMNSFTSTKSDGDQSQRSSRSLGRANSEHQRSGNVSLTDFFKQEEVKRMEGSRRSFRSNPRIAHVAGLQRTASHTGIVNSFHKRNEGDDSVADTPATSSMTSQTFSSFMPSTPNSRGRGSVLRSFSFSDRGDDLLLQLQQSLRTGELDSLGDTSEDNTSREDDKSVRDAEALVGLMSDLRGNTSRSSRTLGNMNSSLSNSLSTSGRNPLRRSLSDKSFLAGPEKKADLHNPYFDRSDGSLKVSCLDDSSSSEEEDGNQSEVAHWVRRFEMSDNSGAMQTLGETSAEDKSTDTSSKATDTGHSLSLHYDTSEGGSEACDENDVSEVQAYLADEEDDDSEATDNDDDDSEATENDEEESISEASSMDSEAEEMESEVKAESELELPPPPPPPLLPVEAGFCMTPSKRMARTCGEKPSAGFLVPKEKSRPIRLPKTAFAFAPTSPVRPSRGTTIMGRENKGHRSPVCLRRVGV